MEHIKITLKGKYSLYSELVADFGYCFYDVDAEDRQYMTYLATPVTDMAELTRKYVVIQGNAEKLNEELEAQRAIDTE